MGFLDRIIGYAMKNGGAYFCAMRGKAGALIAEKNGVKVFEKVVKGHKHLMSFNGHKLQKVVKIHTNDGGVKSIEALNFGNNTITKTYVAKDGSGFPARMFIDRTNYQMNSNMIQGVQIGKNQNLRYEFGGLDIPRVIWNRV